MDVSAATLANISHLSFWSSSLSSVVIMVIGISIKSSSCEVLNTVRWEFEVVGLEVVKEVGQLLCSDSAKQPLLHGFFAVVAVARLLVLFEPALSSLS